ncbi:quinol dehydrogenase ferredoxin subunit NapH [Ruegeria pomeroyi]|uniref:Quinol dehydrogenase ferredoxin subunit NapH n=1 Tax=Ruegeria alba TaxID=2916756 RepID=A0ABS9P0J9_9RHOB|nr:quinol dehydrogenase ferredoxin subunit NapH [Ruegeria alba]MCE8511889.1 quinol dehydrogenase ferredoxin subunit NapH [Ruegeria pomeroyi]MCE8520480.1 quinol dehydrogenase ferredoxin subunit NapH [Ruegeria pomeroyi]MCE8524971.1 quinol dehydrogenase ferredoxin subunit NapH [Ruegeria pomeroyi]MCE8528494.1 quinol dehydrogenase ferredoxin subunit NapH [Ruegeria pomeroyi]MCE8545052.1 quinol dehydrogenase ferredoxin subunit NapH [Ruegeria pomeroyi]
MSTKTKLPTGQEAVAAKGWLGAHKWLILRRFSQSSFLFLFLMGPWLGIWWVTGTLAGSRTFGVLPLTDPFVLLQSMVAGHWPELTAIIGAGIVLAVYALVGGRVYCSWVCPINPVTDAAHWLHDRLGLPKGWQPKRSTRLWILGTVLVVTALTGAIAWEVVNPITMLHRGLVFGMGFAWALVGAVFLFDVVVARHGWCGHLCPVGAFYSLVGRKSLLRISASGRAACDDCMDCFAVCPENQVISPALRGKSGETPLILSPDCTNCGRCIDVCSVDVFAFTHRFDNHVKDTELVADKAA